MPPKPKPKPKKKPEENKKPTVSDKTKTNAIRKASKNGGSTDENDFCNIPKPTIQGHVEHINHHQVTLDEVAQYMGLVLKYTRGFDNSLLSLDLTLPKVLKNTIGSKPIILLRGWGGDISKGNIETFKATFKATELQKQNNNYKPLYKYPNETPAYLRLLFEQMPGLQNQSIYIAWDGDIITTDGDDNLNFTYFLPVIIEWFRKITGGSILGIIIMKLTTCTSFQDNAKKPYMDKHKWNSFNIPLIVFQIPFKDELKQREAFSLFLVGNTLILKPKYIICFGGGPTTLGELEILETLQNYNLSKTARILLNLPRGHEIMRRFEENPNHIILTLNY